MKSAETYIPFLLIVMDVDCGCSFERPNPGGSCGYSQSRFWVGKIAKSFENKQSYSYGKSMISYRHVNVFSSFTTCREWLFTAE